MMPRLIPVILLFWAVLAGGLNLVYPRTHWTPRVLN